MKRRKAINLSVKRDLQLWIFTWILMIVGVSISVALLIVYWFSRKEIGASFYQAHIAIRHVSDILVPVILSGGGVCLLAGALFSLVFPQKIAGPIFRLEEDLKRVAGGNFGHRIRLRAKDRFHSLAGAANDAVGRADEELTKVREALASIEQSRSAGDAEKVWEKIAELRSRMSKLTLS